MYYLTKIFASVSYSSRNKYLFTSDKIYSNVVKETQAEAAILEMVETIFQDHLNSTNQEQSKEVGDLRDIFKEGKTPTTDKVVPFDQSFDLKNKKSNSDFLLVLFFQENATSWKKIFKISLTKNISKSVCFQHPFNNASPIPTLELYFEMKKSSATLYQEASYEALIKNSIVLSWEGKEMIWETVKSYLGSSV